MELEKKKHVVEIYQENKTLFSYVKHRKLIVQQSWVNFEKTHYFEMALEVLGGFLDQVY